MLFWFPSYNQMNIFQKVKRNLLRGESANEQKKKIDKDEEKKARRMNKGTDKAKAGNEREREKDVKNYDVNNISSRTHFYSILAENNGKTFQRKGKTIIIK